MKKMFWNKFKVRSAAAVLAAALAFSMSAPLALAAQPEDCLLYTSDAADEEDSGDFGGRRIVKKKKKAKTNKQNTSKNT